MRTTTPHPQAIRNDPWYLAPVSGLPACVASTPHPSHWAPNPNPVRRLAEIHSVRPSPPTTPQEAGPAMSSQLSAQRALYRRDELSALLALDETQIDRLIRTGQLQPIRICGETRFDSHQLAALITTYRQISSRKRDQCQVSTQSSQALCTKQDASPALRPARIRQPAVPASRAKVRPAPNSCVSHLSGSPVVAFSALHAARGGSMPADVESVPASTVMGPSWASPTNGGTRAFAHDSTKGNTTKKDSLRRRNLSVPC